MPELRLDQRLQLKLDARGKSALCRSASLVREPPRAFARGGFFCDSDVARLHPMSVKNVRMKAGGWVAAGVLLALLASVAWFLFSGRGALPEELTHQPGRAGKVGTLRALEVIGQARSVGKALAAPRLDACDLGRAPDEPTELRSTLTLRASTGQLTRSWEDSLRYVQDGAGRGELVVDATSQNVLDVPVTHQERWTWDESSALEWVGPQSAVEHPPTSPALRRAQEEAQGRFESLMRVISEGWAPSSEGALVPETGANFRCGERARVPSEDWASVLKARASLVHASVKKETRNGDRCRVLVASFALRGISELDLTLEECGRQGPEHLESETPSLRTSLDVLVDEREFPARNESLARWVREGALEAGPEFTHEEQGKE